MVYTVRYNACYTEVILLPGDDDLVNDDDDTIGDEDDRAGV